MSATSSLHNHNAPGADGESAPAPHPRRPSWAGRIAAWVVVPAVLAGLVYVQTRAFRVSTCETYDEWTYLRMGIRIYRFHDVLSLASPMLPPLPILLEWWLPALRTLNPALKETEAFLWEVPELTRLARLLTAITLGIPLVWVVYAWLARRRGWAVGALGGGLAALSPTILAHISIAATDACFALFGVLALAAIQRWVDRRSLGTFLLAGVGIGAALASKQTGVIFFPVVLVELLLRFRPRRQGATRVDAILRTLWVSGLRMAAMVLVAFLVDWACYGFALAPRIGSGASHVPMPVFVTMVAQRFPDPDAIMQQAYRYRPPLALDTFLGQLDHATSGHPAFLLGRYSPQGWWYYFPVAIALKSTPAELVLLGLTALLAARRRTWADPSRRPWLLALIVLLAAGMASAINIGQRYMLLAYPLLILLGVEAIGEFRLRRPSWAAAVGGLLLAWQAWSVAGVAPHYLGYFNELCGGPLAGDQYLSDSNLDWGQDLPALRRELEARNYREVVLAYFGTGVPRVYGLRSRGLQSEGDPVAEGCDWFAVSATTLQGTYAASPEMLERFGNLPAIRVAYSLFLYDLKDPRVRAAFEAWRHLPPSTTSTSARMSPPPKGTSDDAAAQH